MRPHNSASRPYESLSLVHPNRPVSNQALSTALSMALILLTFAGAAGAFPTASRPGPFPDYQVGDVAVMNLTTNPVQAHQPVYRFRTKSGLPDGAQPTLVGTTDSQGQLTNTYTLQATDIGTYTGERFAVGSPSGTPSNVLAYEVHANAPPNVVRPAPFPSYQVGDTAVMNLSTEPPQPNQKVFRYRTKDGLPDGDQPTLIGWTDANGNLTVEVTVIAGVVGSYTSETFAVGTAGGPRSPAKAYEVHATTPPSVDRPAPYPDYQVGQEAVLNLTTSPAQPNQKVFRYRLKDGALDGPQPTMIGWTDANGSFTNSYTPTESDVGDYSGEKFAVGTPASPTSSPSLIYTVASAITPLRVDSISPVRLPTANVTRVRLDGEGLAGAAVSATGNGTLPALSVVSEAPDGRWIDVDVDARNVSAAGDYGLIVSRDTSQAGAVFHLVPPGPNVDALTPTRPERGSTYVLMALGSNLAGTEVTLPGTDKIQVLDMGGDDEAHFALLEIAPDAPIGTFNVHFDNADGVTAVPIEIGAAGHAAASGKGEVTMSQTASKTAMVGNLGDLAVQDLTLYDRFVPIVLDPYSDDDGCTFSGEIHLTESFTLFRSRVRGGASFLGGALTLVAGTPIEIDLAAISVLVDLRFTLCDLDVGVYMTFCLDIAGVFTQCFTVGPNGVIGALEPDQADPVDIVFQDPGDCYQTTPRPTLQGETATFELYQDPNCTCTDPNPRQLVDFSFTAFARTPFARPRQGTQKLFDLRPDANYCPCLAEVRWSGVGFTAVPGGPAITLLAVIDSRSDVLCTYHYLLGSIGPATVDLVPNAGSVDLPPHEKLTLPVRVSFPRENDARLQPDGPPSLYFEVSSATGELVASPLMPFCLLPEKEYSAFLDFESTDRDRANFAVELIPRETTWTSRRVSEGGLDSFTGLFDDCYDNWERDCRTDPPLESWAVRNPDNFAVTPFDEPQPVALGHYLDSVGWGLDVDGAYEAFPSSRCSALPFPACEMGSTVHMFIDCPWGWEEYTSHENRIHVVPGSHTTIQRGLDSSGSPEISLPN